MSALTEYRLRLLRDKGRDGELFREGARMEAEYRNATEPLHRELIEYVRTMAETHPEMTNGEIARSAARVFYEGEVGTSDRH